MFDRREFKKSARGQLIGRWKIPCVAAFFWVLFARVFASSLKSMRGGNSAFFAFFLFAFLSVSGAASVVFSYISLKMARSRGNLSLGDMLVPLGGYWLDGALGALWKSLWEWLWGLLFVVPGIVKAFSYSQIFFVLVENPGIGVRKAMKISKIMTEGHKADLFWMLLSFSGWLALSLLTLGVGLVWLVPYVNSSFANSYEFLKQESMRTGKLNAADFFVEVGD